MKKINDSNLSEILVNAGISKCQSELIHEIFSAARLKNAKNRKYNENWMLLCLLFQIRFVIISTILYIVNKSFCHTVSKLKTFLFNFN